VFWVDVSTLFWMHTKFRVKFTNLLQIPKETVIDLYERVSVSKLQLDQGVKVRLDKGETRTVKTGRGVRQGRSLSPILINL
jgi:hypothetical protein